MPDATALISSASLLGNAWEAGSPDSLITYRPVLPGESCFPARIISCSGPGRGGFAAPDPPPQVTAPQRWHPAPGRHPSHRATARRAGTADDRPRVRLGDLVVDLAAKRVSRDAGPADGSPPSGSPAGGSPAADPPASQDIRLTPTEWHLLEVLLRNPGKLLSQRQLLAEVWGPGYADAAGNLRLYMAQLRRKLEPDPARPRWLLTEPGMGYRYQPGPDAASPDAAAPDRTEPATS